MKRSRLFLACLALLAVACAQAPPLCIAPPAGAEVEHDLEAALAALDFAPLRPCAFGSGFRLETVFLDELPGRPPEARITFEVSRHGARAYLLSHTRAEIPFRAIPQGSHRLNVEVDAVVASGFAGPAGTGEVIAYLRWRHRGVTSELAATLAPSFTEADLVRTAEALLAADLARAASRSPTNTPIETPEAGSATDRPLHPQRPDRLPRRGRGGAAPASSNGRAGGTPKGKALPRRRRVPTPEAVANADATTSRPIDTPEAGGPSFPLYPSRSTISAAWSLNTSRRDAVSSAAPPHACRASTSRGSSARFTNA